MHSTRQLIRDVGGGDVVSENLAAVVFYRLMVDKIKMVARHARQYWKQDDGLFKSRASDGDWKGALGSD
jgi:hypothetical protein